MKVKENIERILEKIELNIYVTSYIWLAASLLENSQYVQNRLELVKSLMQSPHITLIFMCKKRIFQVWVWLFWTFCMSVVFIIFCFFFKVDSCFFVHNRVATLRANRAVEADRKYKLSVCCTLVCQLAGYSDYSQLNNCWLFRSL